jgi:SAM-dependent methyltransferase
MCRARIIISVDRMNEYSPDWIETFLSTIDPAQTQRETAFLQRRLPSARFARVLDICCGLARHAAALALAGYDVTGVDRDATLIAQARLAPHPNCRLVTMDVRDLASLDGSFDAAICMWQSFGYFGGAENEHLLASIAAKLRLGGRFILDIYNRDFFETRQGVQMSQRAGRQIRENKRIDGDRLRVNLIYDDNELKFDQFDWQIFTPDQITALARVHGLGTQLICTNFDEATAASSQAPRMQIVFERF